MGDSDRVGGSAGSERQGSTRPGTRGNATQRVSIAGRDRVTGGSDSARIATGAWTGLVVPIAINVSVLPVKGRTTCAHQKKSAAAEWFAR